MKRAYTYLSHFETNDLGERTLLRGDFAIVHTKNAGTAGITTVGLDPIVTELGLVLAESDASDFAAVVPVSESGKGTPSTSNVEQTIVWLEVEFLTDHGKLVILELLKAFLLLDVQNNAGSVDHARTKEPSVEVVAS